MKKTNSQKTHIIFKILKIRFLSDLKSKKLIKMIKNNQKMIKNNQKMIKNNHK